MTSFNDREKSFEKKFAMDEELKFKAEARRNRLLGQWVAGKLGLSGTAVDDYVKAVRKADLAQKGDDDVLQKIKTDLKDKGINVADGELRKAMDDFLATAVQQLQAESQGVVLQQGRQPTAGYPSPRACNPRPSNR